MFRKSAKSKIKEISNNFPISELFIANFLMKIKLPKENENYD